MSAIAINQDISELQETLATYKAKNSELNETIGTLKQENEKLKVQYIELQSIIHLVIPKYQAFRVASTLGLTSTTVNRIAEKAGLFEDERCAIRQSRVNKKKTLKSETITLYSVFGFIRLYEEILNGLRVPDKHKEISKLIKKHLDKLSVEFLDFSPPSKDDLTEATMESLKDYFEDPKEDNAWQYLLKEQ